MHGGGGPQLKLASGRLTIDPLEVSVTVPPAVQAPFSDVPQGCFIDEPEPVPLALGGGSSVTAKLPAALADAGATEQ
jgi:hypothetical protein